MYIWQVFFGAGLKTGWALKSGGLYHPQSGAGLKTGWTLKSGGLYHLKSGAGLKTGGLPTGFQTPVFTDLGALSARGICRKNEIPLHLPRFRAKCGGAPPTPLPDFFDFKTPLSPVNGFYRALGNVRPEGHFFFTSIFSHDVALELRHGKGVHLRKMIAPNLLIQT